LHAFEVLHAFGGEGLDIFSRDNARMQCEGLQALTISSQ
jgi:hypothetical protein